MSGPLGILAYGKSNVPTGFDFISLELLSGFIHKKQFV